MIERVLAKFTLVCYFPAVASVAETGMKRGCVVLASQALATKLDDVKSLRRLQA